MYSIPESFLEIEVRDPETHGEQKQAAAVMTRDSGIDEWAIRRVWKEDVYRL